MNLPPQLPSSEEPEQQPVLHSSEEAPTQPSLSSDSLSDSVNPASEDASAQPASSPETPVEEPEQPSASSPETPAEEPLITPSEPLAEEPEEPSASSPEPTEEPELQPASPSELPAEESGQLEISPESSEEPLALSSESEETEASELDEDAEISELDEDEDLESEQSLSQPARSGVFIHKGILIAAASVIVVAALLATLLVVVTRPKDPPTDWIASYTPPAGSSTSGKVVYYLHWTNQNGELKGQMQLAAYSNGAPQSLTIPAVGLYNRDNHIIYVVVTIDGQADTLTGKINDANDTLNLNPAGVTSQTSQFVFHLGTADDFKQATKKLATGAATK